MKFKFKIQQYQTDAVEATVNVFAGQPSKTSAQYRRDLGKTKGRIVFDEEYDLVHQFDVSDIPEENMRMFNSVFWGGGVDI